MGLRVGVAGASGYAGGELLRILLRHPGFELGALTAAGNAGQPVRTVHPQLPALGAVEFAPTTAVSLAEHDVIFLALPHGESAALIGELVGDPLVVDLGADYRLADTEAWERFYGGSHAGTWTYGLPELRGARYAISQSRRIANPGCYPTAVALGLAPLLEAGLIEPDDVVVVAASGTSGAGRGLKPSLMGSEVMGAMSAYKAGGIHQHTPEMEQTLSAAAGAPVTLSFTPTLAPMSRGILATCTARLAEGTGESLREAMQAAYDNEPFVHVLPNGCWPTTSATYGGNSAHIQVAADPHAGRAIAVVALDNLVKGAAGQAVQNANIALGLPEAAALTIEGIAP